MRSLSGIDVSRETLERLTQYESLLIKWTSRINLISRGTIDDAWERHFVDSAQVFGELPHESPHLVDLGSGGGFPGLVIAVIAAEKGYPQRISLVESDQRKAQFLRTVIRELGLKASVINARIEDIDPLKADVLTARALAPLDRLFGFADRHLKQHGLALFQKGENWRAELSDAESKWQFKHQIAKSKVHASSVILRVKGLARV